MMRVQDYLKLLSREELVEAYFDYAPNGNEDLFEDMDIDADDIEIAEIKAKRKHKISNFIQRLADMEFKELDCEETYILIAHPCFSQNSMNGNVEHSLVCKEKLPGEDVSLDYYPEENVYISTHHPYETSSLAEIAGLYVADSAYTVKHIYELMAQVLYEALRFGFNQERLPEKYSDIEDPYGVWYKNWDYYFNELEDVPEDSREELDEEPDTKKCSLYMDVYSAIIDYNTYCYAKEVLALRDCLQARRFIDENLPWMMAEAEKKMKK